MIFLFFFYFFILKNYFQNLKNILMTWHVTSVPRGQSCTLNNYHVAKTMPYQQKSGAKNLFQIIFFLQGCNSNFFFYRDENQNTPKLPKHKSYLSHLNIKNCGKEKQANGCHTTWQGPNFVGKRWLAVKFVFKAKRKNCTWKETRTRTTALLVFYLESN